MMKLEIEYNGSFAICYVSNLYPTENNPKLDPFRKYPFNELDNFSKIKVLDAFRTIEEHYKRELKHGT